jgi:hypothetical protein
VNDSTGPGWRRRRRRHHHGLSKDDDHHYSYYHTAPEIRTENQSFHFVPIRFQRNEDYFIFFSVVVS